MRIRSATGDDACALAGLSGELGYPAAAEEVGKRLAAISPEAAHAVFVAETQGGTVIGWIHVFGTLRLESEPFAEIGGLVVAEKYRGRGIGRRLCDAASRWARDHGSTALRVRTRAERQETHRFYEHVGFRRVKTQEVFVRRIDRPTDGIRGDSYSAS